jgi:hypothetical protein
MSLKRVACRAALLAGIGLLSIPAASISIAATAPHLASQTCRIVGAISHRCLSFHSDSMWREGLADYHGSNGG